MTSRPDLSTLPRIDDLVGAAAPLVERYGRRAVTAALRDAVEAARQQALAGGGIADAGRIVEAAGADLATRRPGTLRPVINATGVVLHTNLGRAPLSDAARRAVDDAAGYCDVEYDLGTGQRGSRGDRLEPLLAEAAGAAAATAVNNAAAALVLVLAALAAGRDVLVSRGELVEIGGSFRLPEIMAVSGARLVEVGTTNKTRAGDYARAGDDVALLLRVHPSNYRITGFHEEPSVADLAAVAGDRGVPLVHDVGSGLLTDRHEPWLSGEPSMASSLAAGAGLVLCSGDKLLGGPQAGLLAGRADLVATCKRHPLARALRLDKLRIAALVATLEAHLRGALDDIPAWYMLLAGEARLRERSVRLAERAGGEVVEGTSLVGGGAAPDRAVPGPLVRLPGRSASTVAARLRAADPPVIVRVEDQAVLVDLRTVPEEADEALTARIVESLRGAG